MRLVVDASTLVAEALRERGRRLLRHPTLDLIAATEAVSETEHELRKRVELIAQRGQLDVAAATHLVDATLTVSPRAWCSLSRRFTRPSLPKRGGASHAMSAMPQPSR